VRARPRAAHAPSAARAPALPDSTAPHSRRSLAAWRACAAAQQGRERTSCSSWARAAAAAPAPAAAVARPASERSARAAASAAACCAAAHSRASCASAAPRAASSASRAPSSASLAAAAEAARAAAACAAASSAACASGRFSCERTDAVSMPCLPMTCWLTLFQVLAAASARRAARHGGLSFPCTPVLHAVPLGAFKMHVTGAQLGAP